jgi:hypothetical protein
MFGGQDGNDVSAPRDAGGQDDTLNGVNDIADGTPNDGAQDAGYMPAPSEPAQSDAPEPQAPEPEQPAESPAPADDPGVAAPAATDGDDLIDIKQKALQQLSPLVGHLDQTPEEKFRTTMMLIQASDNQALLKDAYEAANAIEDEKVKAQALLDVINEINYFTQNKQ